MVKENDERRTNATERIMKKLLLLGHTGKLGAALRSAFAAGYDVAGASSAEFDAAEPASVRALAERVRPDIVINAVAFAGTEACERDPERAGAMNTRLPRILAELSREQDFLLVHISTGDVFSGKKTGFYCESEEPRPINVYGATKYAGEQAVATTAKKYYIVRLPILFGRASKNRQFAEKMLQEALSERAMPEIADDIISSPTFTKDAAGKIKDIVEQCIPYGTYHVANRGMTSRYNLVKEMLLRLGMKIPLKRTSYKTFPNAKAINTYTPLASEKIDPLRPWQEALGEWIAEDAPSVIPVPSVIPAKAGIHFGTVQMDSRFRGNDRKCGNDRGDKTTPKKILICGASGFIGRNLAERLARRAAAEGKFEVYGTYFRSAPPEIDGVIPVRTDLTNPNDVDRAVRGMDVVIQAAATTSGAKDIVTRPYYHVTDNAVMNSYIFRAAHEHGVRRVVFFSCSVMYEPSEAPVKETDFNPAAKITPAYFGVGWTKIYIEKMCEFYAGLGKTAYTVIRHSNMYGPHDKFDPERSHVFGATITKVLTAAEGGEITVWGDGREERDLMHVDDLTRFVELALEKQKTRFEIYNAGTGKSVSVNKLVENIAAAADRPDITIRHDPSKPTIKTKLCLDASKAQRELGWTSEIALDEGIRRTLAWVRGENEGRLVCHPEERSDEGSKGLDSSALRASE